MCFWGFWAVEGSKRRHCRHNSDSTAGFCPFKRPRLALSEPRHTSEIQQCSVDLPVLRSCSSALPRVLIQENQLPLVCPAREVQGGGGLGKAYAKACLLLMYLQAEACVCTRTLVVFPFHPRHARGEMKPNKTALQMRKTCILETCTLQPYFLSLSLGNPMILPMAMVLPADVATVSDYMSTPNSAGHPCCFACLRCHLRLEEKICQAEGSSRKVRSRWARLCEAGTQRWSCSL